MRFSGTPSLYFKSDFSLKVASLYQNFTVFLRREFIRPDLQGNMRDYAEINQLICLSNLENINSVLINDGLPQNERLEKLNQIAIQQMKILQIKC